MKRFLMVFFGLVLALLGIAVGAIGGLAISLFDSNGRYELPVAQFESDGAAVYISALNLNQSVVPDRVLTPTLEFEGLGGKEVFMGTGSANDVQQFLSGVPYDAVTELSSQGVVFNSVPGTLLPAPQPVSADIWTESASGSTAAFPWDPQMSEEILVLMNTDGSAGVKGDVHGVLSADWIRGAAIGAVVAAVVLFLLGAWLVVRGSRRPRQHSS